jgi:predicted phage-related endonuclease
MQVIPKPEHGSLGWLKVRHRDDEGKVTFGASEAGALMGVSEYTTLTDLCISKLYPPEVKEPEPQMVKGLIFEAPLLTEAGRLLGLEVTTPNVMYRKGRFTVTLDGLAHQPFTGYDNPTRIIEAKVTSAYTVATPDDLPRSWVMQGHVQQWVLGLPVSFIVFDKRQHINLVDMPYNAQLMDDILNVADVVGYDLDSGVMPDYAYKGLTSEQVQRLYPVVESRNITADDELVNHVFDLETTRKQIKELKEQEQELVDTIARALGDADEITDAAGFTMLTWRQQKGRLSFDTKAFQLAHPDLFAQFTKEGAPFRVMRFGKGNK